MKFMTRISNAERHGRKTDLTKRSVCDAVNRLLSTSYLKNRTMDGTCYDVSVVLVPAMTKTQGWIENQATTLVRDTAASPYKAFKRGE